MSSGASLELQGRVAVVTLVNAPVNGLSHAVRNGVMRCLDQAEQHEVAALVLVGDGATFSAGADIAEFASGGSAKEPMLNEVVERVSALRMHTIAAIHGAALGGGLELALACHCRLMDARAKCGLPEVHLGLIPGAGGTQRLPRLVGCEMAIRLMTSGKTISAKEAAEVTIADEVIEPAGKSHIPFCPFVTPDFSYMSPDPFFAVSALSAGVAAVTSGAVLGAAVHMAKSLTSKPIYVSTSSKRVVANRKVPSTPAGFFETVAKLTKNAANDLVAPVAVVEAVRAAAEASTFEAGLKREAALFRELASGGQSKALQHIFFSERRATKVPGLKRVKARPLRRAAVIGAGTMGGGIAMCFAQAAVPVTLVDQSPEALHRGVKMMRANWEASCKKGKLSRAALECYVSMVSTAPSLDSAAIREADVVVEAVFERLSIKKSIFSLLDNLCKRGAMLATNTSTLDIDAIAAATSRPEVSLTTLFVPYMSRPTYPVYHCLLLFAGGHWNTLLLAGQCDAAARECAWEKNGAGDDRHRHGHGQAAGEEDGAGWQLLWLHWQPADRILWARGHLHARGGALPLRGRRSDARLRHAHGTAPNVRSRRE